MREIGRETTAFRNLGNLGDDETTYLESRSIATPFSRESGTWREPTCTDRSGFSRPGFRRRITVRRQGLLRDHDRLRLPAGCRAGDDAGTDDLKVADSVFKQEAQDITPKSAPKTVNTAGWKGPDAAWKLLWYQNLLISASRTGSRSPPPQNP